MNKAKLIGLVVSIIIVVGLAIGLIFGVRHAYYTNDSMRNPLAGTIKPIQVVCNPTQFHETCIQSLNTVSRNKSSTLRDYFHAIVNATIDATKQSVDRSESLGSTANDPFHKMAFQDCVELLKLSLDNLHDVYTNLSIPTFPSLKIREHDLKNWLSATISYQQSCIDGVEDPNLKKQIANALESVYQLTSNALAVVSEMVPILNGFGIDTSANFNARRLLTINENNAKKGGGMDYPTWFSIKDRELFGRINTNDNPMPSVIVAQDGSGQYRTINEALAAYPKNLQDRYVIYVKQGIYDEQIIVTKDQSNILMYGDGPRKTIITGKKCNRDNVTTYQSASFAVIGSNFIAKSIGFQNTAGPEGHQAVALRVQSDMSAFYNCRMDGYQDTLYAQANRQFYRNCVISGTVDFIFGDGTVMIQNSLIIVRKPLNNQQNTVTAQGKKDFRETTGIVLHNCKIVPEKKLYPTRFTIQTFLGRPWKEFSTTVIMQSVLGDLIQPAGWMPWAGNFALDTLFYAEYGNSGPGSNTSRRVNWRGYHVITKVDEAMKFSTDVFIQGDEWVGRLGKLGIPYLLGLKN